MLKALERSLLNHLVTLLEMISDEIQGRTRAKNLLTENSGSGKFALQRKSRGISISFSFFHWTKAGTSAYFLPCPIHSLLMKGASLSSSMGDPQLTILINEIA
jgi:hypothetical protein